MIFSQKDVYPKFTADINKLCRIDLIRILILEVKK